MSQITTRQEDDALAFIDQPSPEALQAALAEGQLQKLSTDQRLKFLAATCRSVGLNPLTRPFEFITLQGKITMYARKDATDQLRRLHNVSLRIVSREVVGDVLMVTAQAVAPGGRQDEAIGAVPWPRTGAEAQALAAMKAETKAKRRVTLSICGLGFMDESEIEGAQTAGSFSEPSAPTMPQTAEVQPRRDDIQVEVVPPEQEPQEPGEQINESLLDLMGEIEKCTDAETLNHALAEGEYFTAKRDKLAAWSAMKARADVLGLKFDKTAKKFI